MQLTYSISPQGDNMTVKQILKEKLYISTKLLLKLKQTASIFCNHEPALVTKLVHAGDRITLDLEKMEERLCLPKFEDKFQLIDKPLDILYEDDYLLIVNKPAGIPVHPSCMHYENTLSNYVAAYLQKQQIYRIHIVTRLDKNTSGVCIFSKHEYIQELYVRKKEEIKLTKEYITIVQGIVSRDHGILQAPIARKEGSIILREVNTNGIFAKTEYFVQERNVEKNYTVMRILLHTGRTHQIRVHMANMGHVLLGDDLYANEYGASSITEYIKRQALHCTNISFWHPMTQEKIMIHAPYPEDLKKLLK